MEKVLEDTFKYHIIPSIIEFRLLSQNSTIVTHLQARDGSFNHARRCIKVQSSAFPPWMTTLNNYVHITQADVDAKNTNTRISRAITGSTSITTTINTDAECKLRKLTPSPTPSSSPNGVIRPTITVFPSFDDKDLSFEWDKHFISFINQKMPAHVKESENMPPGSRNYNGQLQAHDIYATLINNLALNGVFHIVL
ncbi:hypothetical protein FRB94_012722 [Tulasnella sp. JGI-2019a]|nr:hypothetical protein FRB94_012722 [Tulasnella sp. JGI-2019a]